MKDRLVVGYDGSQAAMSAVKWAALEASVRKASVRVIGAYSIPVVEGYYGVGIGHSVAADLEQLRQYVTQQLTGAVARMQREYPAVGFDFEAIHADGAECLITAAGEADLVVVGGSGAGAAKSFWLGSVAAQVLRSSPCPTVVVPVQVRKRRGTIVVGSDGSECSARALAWAAEEADRMGSELVVVHAWQSPWRLTRDGVDRGGDFAEVDASLLVEQAVREARELTNGAIDGRTRMDHPVDALLDESANADLIVVGSRGRGGFRAMLLGSVAQAVCARSTCPVVVVR